MPNDDMTIIVLVLKITVIGGMFIAAIMLGAYIGFVLSNWIDKQINNIWNRIFGRKNDGARSLSRNESE